MNVKKVEILKHTYLAFPSQAQFILLPHWAGPIERS